MKNNRPTVGIDPGLKGAIAWIDNEGAHVVPMPLKGNRVDTAAVTQLIRQINPKRIVIERQQVMHKPGQKEGPTGAFTMGTNFGILLGICQADYPTFTPTPQKWKKLLAGTKKDKAAAIAFCLKHYPDVSLLKTPRCTEPDDNYADALCIATFGDRASARKK